jgi:hypothetical protein
VSGLTFPIAAAIIGQDRYSIRFEKFCNALIGQHEGGVAVLSTSESWDLGRDGRGQTRLGTIYTCCSLRDDVDEKAVADLTRLAANLKQGSCRVYFCSSQPLSEKQCTDIGGRLSGVLGANATLVVYGRDHLAELSVRHPDALLQQYKAEHDNLTAVLRGGADSASAEEAGLRLALIASSGEDTAAIRREIYLAGIRSVFRDRRPRTANEVATDLAAFLHLSRSIPTDIVNNYLLELDREGEITTSGNRFVVTRKAESTVDTLEQVAANKLLVGRQYIRERLEVAIGQHLSDEHFAVIWNVIQERITHHFYSRGQEIVTEISRLVEKGSVTEEAQASVLPFVEDLAKAVAATSSHAQQQEELHDAIRDLFTERAGPAFDWLVRLCFAFVGACSLGLESTVGAAITNMLKRITLVLDTDVVLSLLSEGEPDHQSVDAIVNRWRSLGGTCLVARPVLQEATYHAWIAENDYREIGHLLPGTEEDRIRYIDNAFVRGFAHNLALGKATPRQWGAYVAQFKGESGRDTRPIAAVLQADYGISEMRDRAFKEKYLERRVCSYLIEQVHKTAVGRDVHNRIDKAKRDARLYASLVSEIKLQRKSDPSAACLLVSSARRLVEAEKKFREIRDTHIVIPIPMALYLISLVPQVSLGMGAMKAFLFDERVVRFSSDLERTLLRVVRASSTVSMPFAKRGALMRAFRERAFEDARQMGMRAKTKAQRDEIEAAALEKSNLPRTMENLRNALDSVAATTSEERERQRLVARIAELERELARARKAH